MSSRAFKSQQSHLIEGAATRLAICAPIFNEEQGISDFLIQVDATAEQIRRRWPSLQITMILANDGSSDQGPKIALEYAARSLAEIRILHLSRNFGHAAAVTALFDEAAPFDAMILMDADLQDDPFVLPSMVDAWMNGFESVRIARRRRREGRLFAISSKLFYRLFHTFSKLDSDLGTFGLYDRKVVHAVLRYPERVRYIPGIVTLAGFKTFLIRADRNRRAYGESRVGLKGLLKLANVALFSFSTLPLQMMAVLGFLIALFSMVGGAIAVSMKLFTDRAIPGWASLLTVEFFFGGLIIFCLGIIGQYIGIVFEEVKARPPYILRERSVRSFDSSESFPKSKGF